MYKHALCSELDGEEWTDNKKDVPQWIQLIPEGPEIKGFDGREWVLNNPQAVIEHFNAKKLSMVIDYEHSTELKAKNGEPAPAAGWVKELTVKEGGSIWGKVEWTKAAIKSIQEKEYKYISPVFMYRPESLEIVKINSVGLTNKPNLVMKALNHRNDLLSGSVDLSSEEWQQVAKALNVESLNRPNDILQALNRQQIEGLNKKYLSSIDALISDGYIAPCEKEFYLAACRESGYDEAMNRIKFIRQLKSPFAHLFEQQTKAFRKPDECQLSETEKAVCREMGIEEKQYSSFVKGE